MKRRTLSLLGALVAAGLSLGPATVGLGEEPAPGGPDPAPAATEVVVDPEPSADPPAELPGPPPADASAPAAPPDTAPPAPGAGAGDTVTAAAEPTPDDTAMAIVDQSVPPELASGYVFPALAAMPDGSRVVFYGAGDPLLGPVPRDTWVWEGGTWTPRCGTAVPGATGPCGPGPRGGRAMATAPNGVVLYGGSDGAISGPFPVAHSDTWLFDGTSWRQVCPDGGCPPGPRILAASAGDFARTLLFGGIAGLDGSGNPNLLGEDTWSFDGSLWSQVCGTSMSLPCGPTPRYGAAMAWDGARFVLFGGVTMSAMSDETWVFNGVTWDRACGGPLPACGPPGRGLSSMAHLAHPYASLRGALLTGGLTGDGQTQTMYRDMWFWNGSFWRAFPTPWPSSVTFAEVDGPPVASYPLAPMVAGVPANCEVLWFNSVFTGNQSAPIATQTKLVGWDLAGSGVPSACPQAPQSQTVTPVAAPPEASAVSATEDLPFTGAPVGLYAIGAVLLGTTGLALVCAGRRRRAESLPPANT